MVGLRTHETLDVALYHVEIPLVAPFRTATGTISVRSVGLVSAVSSGCTGWGEAAPFPGQDEPFAEVLEAARSGFTTPALVAAANEAISDLRARMRGERLASQLGETNEAISMSVAIGMGNAAVAHAAQASESGVTRFKVKIMPGRTSHIAKIRHAVPHAIIGIDANGSFDASTIPEIVALSDLDIAYVEQPTVQPDTPALGVLNDAGFTVFVDESARSVLAAERALACPDVAGVVIKPGRLGWAGSLEVVDLARTAGKLWRASGLLETGVGRSFTAALAAADDAFVSDITQATRFLSYDVAAAPQVQDGRLLVPSGPGSGIDVDAEFVRERAVEVIGLSGSAIPDLG